MLGIHGVGRDGADYYLSDLARELPVAEPGCWVGTAAAGSASMARSGPSASPDCSGAGIPRTGQPMGSGRVGRGRLRPDLQRSQVGQRAVRTRAARPRRAASSAVHAEAVAGALTYLEQHAVTAVRRSGGERVVIPTTGMVAARFTHAVNRNGDPHLHSHVVMANLVHGADGRWSACDRRGIDGPPPGRVGGLRGAPARRLARRARRALVAERPGARPRSPASGRSCSVSSPSRAPTSVVTCTRSGRAPGRGARIAWAVTRPAKAPVLSRGDLVAEWDRRARAVGGPRQRCSSRDDPAGSPAAGARRAPLRRR